MMIFDKARENAVAVSQIGLAALKEGARTGAPIHYMDASLGDGMVRHFPDGTRHLMHDVDGEWTVIKTLEPGVSVNPR